MKKFLSILLAVMMVLSTVSLAAPSLADVNDTVVEAAVDSLFEADEAADLAATTTIEEDTYGVLLWNLDFEDTTYPASGSVSNCGPVASYATTEPTLPEEFTGYYRIEMPTTATDYVEMNGSKVMPVYASGAYPFFGIASYSSSSNWTKGGTSMPCGYYTVVGDFAKAETNSAGSVRSRISNGGGKTAGTTVSLSTTMTTIAHDFKITESATTAGYYVFGASDDSTTYEYDTIQSIGTYFGTTTVGETYYVDNYKVYWKPLTVDVTVEAGDNAYATGVTLTDVANDGTVTVADLVADVESLNAKLVATGVVYNDKEYALTDSIGFGGDATVEVVWEEVSSEWYSDEYGTLVWVTNFDKANDGSSIATGDYTSVLNGSTENTKYNKLWSVLNPNYSVYSDVADEVLLSSNFNVSEVYYDETLGSNVFRGTSTSAQSFPQLNWLSRYGERANYDFFKDRDSVISVVNLYKNDTISSPTYRYNGYDTDIKTNNGGDKAQDSYEKLADLDNGWSKWVGVWSWPETNSDGTTCYFDAFKLHVNGTTTAGQYSYFDDIKMYVKPKTATLTVDNSEVGIANLVIEDYDTTGVDVSEIISQIERPYGYVLAGLSRTKGGEYIEGTAAIGGNTVLYADWVESDEKNWETDNGILLFDIDFEDERAADIFTASTSNNNYLLSEFSKVNPNIDGYNKWALSTSGMDVIGIEDGALKIQWDGSGKWPQILVGNPSNAVENVFIGENGIYHAHFEVKPLTAVDANLTSIALTANGVVDGTHKGTDGILGMGTGFYTKNNAVVADQWHVIDGSKSTWTNDTDGMDNDDINKITTVFTHSATQSEAGGYYLVDNIRLYWRPATVNVTVYGGSNGNFETVTLENVSTSATIDEIIALLPDGGEYGVITSLADMNGNKLTAWGPVSDTKVVAVWTPWVEVAGGQEFAETASGVKDTTMWYGGSYGYSGDVGTGGDHTTAVHTMYNNLQYTSGGNMFRKQITPQIGDADTGTNDTDETVQEYSIPAARTVGNETIRIQVATSLEAGNDAAYVLVKYRYNDLPDLAELVDNCPNPDGYKYTLSDDGLTINYVDRNGEDASATLQPEYGTKYFAMMGDGSYAYAGGEEFHNNELMVEGEWYCDYLPMTDAMKTNGVARVYIQHANVFHNQSTEIDYVRFIKLGEEEDVVLPETGGNEGTDTVKVNAPASLEGSQELRMTPEEVASCDSASIRFKATVDAVTNTNAVDIGFVVAAESKVSALGSYDEYLVVGADYARVGYLKQDGINKYNYFDSSDDEALVMAAFLNNIDPDHYASYIVVRPFVRANDQYYYGTPYTTRAYDIASEIYYNDDLFCTLTYDQQSYIEVVVLYCEENNLV